MALCRQFLRAPALLSQCQRLSTAHQIKSRSYADIALTFASPSDIYYKNADVKEVDVETMTGSFGIRPEHVPTIGVLKPGIVNVVDSDGKSKQYFVSSGLVTVNANSAVHILAEEAHPLDRFDKQAVSSALTDAQQRMGRASDDASKAEVQVEIDCLEALQKVV